MMQTISNATARNWNRLNIVPDDCRLTSRANKTHSSKRVMAKNYLNNPAVTDFCRCFTEYNGRIDALMLGLCIECLRQNKILTKAHVQNFLARFADIPCNTFAFGNIPDGLFCCGGDVLGFIYQSILSEGQRNAGGIYYSSSEIVTELTQNIHVKSGESFLDPTCGSGAFLLAVEADSPLSLYGFDNDRIAVMICGTNLLVKYREEEFAPNVFVYDFLDRGLINVANFPVSRREFDYVYTNPPWGVNRKQNYKQWFSDIRSGERSSMVMVEAVNYLKPGGLAGFILPTSLLNIDTHADIRRYILEHTAIKKLTLYSRKFDGVFTDFFSIEVDCDMPCQQNYDVFDGNTGLICHVSVSEEDRHLGILPTSSSHEVVNDILSKINRLGAQNLSQSTWALGIVTGDNKHMLMDEISAQTEPIYTGKEVEAFRLRPPRRFVKFQADKFQQVAPEAIYRSAEKIIYKFIARYPVVAYDNSGALTLNSANIVIPKLMGLSVKSVCAMLNSSLFRFAYMQINKDIKVLKKGLNRLKFPILSAADDAQLSAIVDEVLIKGMSDDITKRLDTFMFALYGISSEEADFITQYVK